MYVRDLATLTGRFGTVYADPPWPYDNGRTRGAAVGHYPTLRVAEIAALPIPALTAPAAHCHLWTTTSFLFEARGVLDAWGFAYKSQLIWIKPDVGMGNYWRVSHEILLLGVKGRAAFRDRSLPSWVSVPRGEHSRKPDQVRRLIERVSPGPYLECFGRDVTPGWTVWGNSPPDTLFTSREAYGHAAD